jgi:hypothetical protein
MAAIAINVLWFLIGLIILAGVIYLAMWVIETFILAIPEKIKQGIWVIVFLLALIALISAIVGGGSVHMPFRLGQLPGGAVATLPAGTAVDLS